MKISVPEYILSIKPYSPGKPIEETEREYGIHDSVKLASNENPLGPSPGAVEAMGKILGNVHRYPDGEAHELIRKLSEKLGVSFSQVILGNGSDEIIGMLTRAFLQPGDEAILPQPSFLMYDIMVRSSGAKPVPVPLKNMTVDLDGIRKTINPRSRMIFLNNPNNPTGTIFSKNEFETFLQWAPRDVIIVVDEAYIEFVRDPQCPDTVEYLNHQDRALVVLRTFSKAYGLAGLRIGYGVMPGEIVDILQRIRQPFNASLPAQAGACAALDDEKFLKKTIDLVHDGLDFLYGSLEKMGVKFFPTQTNFFLMDVEKNADEVFESLLRRGIIVRSMTSYGYPEYIRVSVGLEAENRKFIAALGEVL